MHIYDQIQLGLDRIGEPAAMFKHTRQPQVLNVLSREHARNGVDLRTLSDEELAEAAARAILPEWDRLWCHLDSANAQYEELANLLSSIQRRVARILVQNTRVVKIVENGNLPQTLLDELVESTTLAFVHMVGAFDGLAIINGLLAGETDYWKFAWQKERFRDLVRVKAPEAAALMDEGTPGDLYFKAVRAFRNSIHNRMPDIGYTRAVRDDDDFVGAVLTLDSRGHQKIIDEFIAAGWTSFQGVTVIDTKESRFLSIRPEAVLNHLMNEGVPLLNQLLAATPIELLGDPRFKADADGEPYPTQMQQYAVQYLRLTHLLPKQA